MVSGGGLRAHPRQRPQGQVPAAARPRKIRRADLGEEGGGILILLG